MDYKETLLADLNSGFSKSDLEKLIGLPKNNLSGILKGDRNLSKKSKLKIDKWMKSKKPDPLELINAKGFNMAYINPTIQETGVKYFLDTENKVILKKSQEGIITNISVSTDNSEILKQISDIKTERIPKERDTPMGRKVWANDQRKRIAELESKIIN